MFRQRLHIVLFILLALMASGCTCRTKSVGPDTNFPVASTGGPLHDVHFAFDSSALDATAKSTLSRNAEWLKANPNATAKVEGHCDERGTNEYNMALGARRARSAHDYLVHLGIEKSRLSTVSYGEELPLDPAHNEDAWAKNRRAHFDVKE